MLKGFAKEQRLCFRRVKASLCYHYQTGPALFSRHKGHPAIPLRKAPKFFEQKSGAVRLWLPEKLANSVNFLASGASSAQRAARANGCIGTVPLPETANRSCRQQILSVYGKQLPELAN
jgi:hypothetical protein